MAVQNVANNPIGSYPVLVDKNTANAEMQVLRLDVGVGTAESRVSSSNPLPVNVISGLIVEAYDYIELSYTGSNLTGVIYKTGGSGGTTIATLTLAYSGSDLTSVTRT